MAVPCALIASCTDLSPNDLAIKILGSEDLSSGEHVLENVTAYPWHINTKYYTADVRICTTENRTIGTEEFADSVQALILIFDSKEESSFEKVASWMPFAKEIDAPVEMLVCQRCEPEDVISRAKVHAWCLENSFELVELDPETFSDEEEDDFPETTGVKRIIQALHAHMWPNLEMKDSPSFRSPYMNQMMANEAVHRQDTAGETVDANRSHRPPEESSTTPDIPESNTISLAAGGGESAAGTGSFKPETDKDETAGNAPAGPSETSPSISKEEKNRANCMQASQEQESLESIINNDDIAMLSSFGNEDISDESFEQLFERMQLMKQRAENLPPDQRKAYAEKVAITFWKAIGGDDAEIEGLSDEDP